MTEKRNALQLEKKHKKVFEKEIAMTREAIIKEKSDIQTMRVALQTEKKKEKNSTIYQGATHEKKGLSS